MKAKIVQYILGVLPMVHLQAANTNIDSIFNIGLTCVTVTTVDGEEPTCDVITPPMAVRA